MRSIKPGRGPSMMSGVVGIFMIGFGIVWTVLAARASGIMVIFGILWTCIAIATTIYNFKNATSKNRYSQFDITEHGEEIDPLNERFGDPYHTTTVREGSRFCPYCGKAVDGDYNFCNGCGKKLP